MTYLFLALSLLICNVMLFIVFYRAVSAPVLYLKHVEDNKNLSYFKEACKDARIYILIGCDKNAGDNIP